MTSARSPARTVENRCGASAVEIAFHRMPWSCQWQAVVVSEAPSPQPVARVEMARHRISGSQHAREPRAATVLGQVHDEVVPAAAQRRHQPAFGTQLRDRALSFPFAVDGVDGGDGGMSLQHRRGFAVDQRVDLGARKEGFERGEDRRGQQHVTVMAKLDDQHAANEAGIDGVRQRAWHGWKIAKCDVRYKLTP